MKKVLLISIFALLVVSLTGCGGTKKMENCDGCVFAYYTETMSFNILLDSRKELTNYTSDYKTLKDEDGKQRKIFLGHILNSEDRITRAYACGVENGKAFCLESSSNSEVYKRNISVLKKIYGEKNCKEYFSHFACEGELNASTSESGHVEIRYNDNTCEAGGLPEMQCE